jgi:LacI family transcriptional regulator
MTTEHLIFQGCKHIAHFSGSQNIELYRQRKNGYLAALKKHHIPINNHYIFESNLSEEDGVYMAKNILELNTIDGIISANDTAAISAMQYLKSQGVKIPEDIAVTGFNNDPISAVIEPSLTTINQPAFEIGNMSSTILIEQIGNKTIHAKSKSKLLNSELIIRNSSRK